MNIAEWLEFKFIYFETTVQHITPKGLPKLLSFAMEKKQQHIHVIIFKGQDKLISWSIFKAILEHWKYSKADKFQMQ